MIKIHDKYENYDTNVQIPLFGIIEINRKDQTKMHFFNHYIFYIIHFIAVAFYNAVCTKIFQVKHVIIKKHTLLYINAHNYYLAPKL